MGARAPRSPSPQPIMMKIIIIIIIMIIVIILLNIKRTPSNTSNANHINNNINGVIQGGASPPTASRDVEVAVAAAETGRAEESRCDLDAPD